MNPDNPIVMYLIVRESLNMSPGKIAAQVGHGVQYLYERALAYEKMHAYQQYVSSYQSKVDIFTAWNEAWHRKVVLQADEKEWKKMKEELISLDKVIVIDKGLTELVPDTETVIGFYPMYKNDRPKIIKRLQVLK
jgi:peptidyl-tRNA hydrolase